MAAIEAFETFMKNHQNMVYSVAMRLLAHPAEAADISQEVFLKAYDRFTDLESNPRAGAWLRTVATNLCLNHLKRYRARWRFFTDMFHHDQEDRRFEETLPDPSNTQDEEDLEHQRHYLEEALRRLPDAQRVPLVLYHFDELSYEEIARQLGASLSKVKTDIHRGRQSLRRWLRAGWGTRDEKPGQRIQSDPPRKDLRKSLPPLGAWAAPSCGAVAAF